MQIDTDNNNNQIASEKPTNCPLYRCPVMVTIQAMFWIMDYLVHNSVDGHWIVY